MKKKEFKLLIEGFNKYLLNELNDHTDECIDLIAAIPDAFSDFINENFSWYNGIEWANGVDYSNDTDGEADAKLLFEAVAAACGCEVKDLLVAYDDVLSDELCDSSRSLTSHDLTKTFILVSGTLCGEFKIDDSTLKGFYFSTAGNIPASVRAGFKNEANALRNLHGLIFVAPKCDSATGSPEKEDPKPTAAQKGEGFDALLRNK
jgi:hypothetical protein